MVPNREGLVVPSSSVPEQQKSAPFQQHRLSKIKSGELVNAVYNYNQSIKLPVIDTSNITVAILFFYLIASVYKTS